MALEVVIAAFVDGEKVGARSPKRRGGKPQSCVVAARASALNMFTRTVGSTTARCDACGGKLV